MWIVFNNLFTFAFAEELQKAVIKSIISPLTCCHTILENLNVQLCNFTAKAVNSEAMQNRYKIINYNKCLPEMLVLVHMSTKINFKILQHVSTISVISIHA